MPLAQTLIHLHLIHTTMTSPSPPAGGGPACRGGGIRKITTLTIPSSPSPAEEEETVNGRVGTGSIVAGEAAESLRRREESVGAHGGHSTDFPCVPLATPPNPGSVQDCKKEARHTVDGFLCDSKDSPPTHDLSLYGGNTSGLSKKSIVSGSDLRQEPSSSFSPMHHSAQHTTGVASPRQHEIVPALKRKDSPRNRPRTTSSSRTVSLSEPAETSAADPGRDSSKTPSTSTSNHGDFKPTGETSSSTTSSTTTTTPTPAAPPKRRISFPADSVLTAVIQDGDTAELLRILTGRHGPGLVPSPTPRRAGEGGSVVCVGVDVRQSNHVGLTALHHAVLANNLDAAKLLLCHGAEVNAQDVHGFSPLHTAAACGSLPLTTLLLLFGADVFSQTMERELPVDVAKELRVVRVLTTEMTRLVHQELWVGAVLRAHADEAWLLARKLLACALLFVLHVFVALRTLWGKRRTRHPKGD